MTDAELRERYPEIPWQVPVPVTITLSMDDLSGMGTIERYACRYCIALFGLRAEKISTTSYAFLTRGEALRHVEAVHP